MFVWSARTKESTPKEEPKEQPETVEPEPSEQKPEETKPEPETAEEPKVEETKEAPAEESTEVKAEEKVEKSEDEVIQDWAVKNNLTYAEAKEDLEATKGVIAKYKTSEEIAKALRKTQSAYDKLRTESAKEKEAQEEFKISENPQLEVDNYFEHGTLPNGRSVKEAAVETYRRQFPNKSADMTDEAIIEEQKYQATQRFMAWQGEKVKEMKSLAGRKREDLLSTLAEADRRFVPDVKVILDGTDDRTILNKNFNLKDIVYWAKGQRFEDEIKKAEERGYKRALENPKIVGQKVTQSAVSKPKSASVPSVNLTADEKYRARQMFDMMSEQEAYEAYAEVAKKRKK